MANGIQTTAVSEGSEELAALLDSFEVTALGDGNAAAGTSQLAAMAIVLANLARPESGIEAPDGRLFEIGCNVLATGPLVSSAVLDSVVKPVDRCQNNLLAHLERLMKTDREEDALGPNRRWKLGNNGQLPVGGEGTLLQLMSTDPDIAPLYGEASDQWLEILGAPPAMHFEDLSRCPRAFIAAPSPRTLEEQLSGAHLGQALVSISLSRPSEVSGFGTLCPALIDGLVPAGPSGETVCGRLLVTDNCEIIRNVVKSATDRSAWLGRLFWLVDGSAGPDLPSPAENTDIIRLPMVALRFEKGVRMLFANRLTRQRPVPVTYKFDFAPYQAQWMGFLTDMERTLPGISAVARRLLASLVFGLRQLATAAPSPAGFRFTTRGVAALGRLLIHRMSNHHAAILYSAEDARSQRNKRRILEKLADGGLNTRGIYHPLHLDADTTRGLLAELEADQLVKRNGTLWERVERGQVQPGHGGCLQLEL